MKKINFKIGDKIKITEDEERLCNAPNPSILPKLSEKIITKIIKCQGCLKDSSGFCNRNLLEFSNNYYNYCELKFEMAENWILVNKSKG